MSSAAVVIGTLRVKNASYERNLNAASILLSANIKPTKTEYIYQMHWLMISTILEYIMFKINATKTNGCFKTWEFHQKGYSGPCAISQQLLY